MTRTEIIKELVNRGYNASAVDVQKNGVMFDGITIKEEGANIAPTIYTEEIIARAEEDNLSLDVVVDELIETIKEHNGKDIDIENLLSRDSFEKNLKIAFFKYVRNDVLFQNTEFDGIKSVLIIYTDLDDGIGTIQVSENLLVRVGLSVDEAWEIAKKNTLNDVNVYSLNSLFNGLPGGDCPMYVFTNKHKMYGASAILDKEELKKLAGKFDVKKLIALPSSVHEMLVIPYDTDSGCKIDELSDMVRMINEAHVAEHEQLADKAFVIEI